MRSQAAGAFDSTFAHKRNFAIIIIVMKPVCLCRRIPFIVCITMIWQQGIRCCLSALHLPKYQSRRSSAYRRAMAALPAAAQPGSSEQARRTGGDATAATSHAKDRDFLDADVFREIAAAVKRIPQDIESDMQHSEGAAFHAAILAGKEALAKGKPKHEVAAVIESAGANVCGPEKWRRSGSILIAEAHVIGTRGQRFGTLQDQADLEYIAAGH